MDLTLSFRRAVSSTHDRRSDAGASFDAEFSFARSDVPAIVDLVESAYRGEASRAGWTTEADLLDGQRTDHEQVEGLIRGPRSRIVLALAPALACVAPPDDEPALVGSMLLELSAGHAYVGMVAVRPAFQARGVGRALLAECERIVRGEQPGSTLRMTVIGQRSELIAWYERRGYRRTGERQAFPYGQPRFGLPRRPDLYFEVLEKELATSSG
jgi:ribosomal protein S18 acetylase RimI-like enzyme